MSNTEDYMIIKCPHCKEDIFIFIKELNCKIFRHGIYKSNYEQIPPHLDKEKCDKLVEDDLIIGCGKPFKINEEKNAINCDYI
jgi:phage FluMu protein Com